MALQKFIRSTDNMIQFDAELDESLLSATSIFSLEVHRDEMKSIWANVKTLYEQCMSEPSPDDATEAESVADRYQKAYAVYVSFISKLNSRIQYNQNPPPRENKKEEISCMNINLPACESIVFYGDYHTWPTFRDMFTAMYLRNTRLSDFEKLCNLTKYTRDEARTIVQKAPLSNDGLAIAWAGLVDRFENNRMLFNRQLQFLREIPCVTSESCDGIKNLRRDITSCIASLKLCGVDIKAWEGMFVFECSTRLPAISLDLWEQTVGNKKQIPTWEEMDSFLYNRFLSLESVADVKSKSSLMQTPSTLQQSSRPHSKKIQSHHVNIYNNSVPQCKICPASQHPIRQCPKFLQMNPDERLSCIKKYGLCLNCFAKQHNVKDCKSSHNCFHCHKRHNTLLHKDNNQISETTNPLQLQSTTNQTLHSNFTPNRNPNSNAQMEPNQNPPTSQGPIRNFFGSCNKHILLATAMVQVHHCGIQFPARAFFDPGSEATFISEKLFRRVKPPHRPITAEIGGLNDSVTARPNKICSIVLGSNGYSNKKIEIDALVLNELSGNLPSKPIEHSIVAKIPNLHLADPKFYKSSQIDILIGEDSMDLFELDGFKRNICGRLKARETIFGWVISGNTENQQKSTTIKFVSFFSEMNLEKQLCRFWEVEDLPKKQIISPADRFCEDFYTQTTKRTSNGRYIVSLPFKKSFFDGSQQLGNSRRTAYSQYLRSEQRLSKNIQYKQEYDAVINEYLSLNHMTEVCAPQSSLNPKCYYLPHHAVMKTDRTTTKVRVVFNASCPSSNGTSLNDLLYTGPVLQNDLMVLLLKWRLYQFVFNSDIEKMYRQILVNPTDTAYQRILFRNSSNSDIKDYELKTVTFGLNCAPFLAIRTILQLAMDVEKIYPLASEILRHSIYVDDVLSGSHDISTAIKARTQLAAALESGGFKLRKWTSNCPQVLQGILKEHLLQEDFLEFDDTSQAKTLGVKWNAKSDVFLFSSKPLAGKDVTSKRQVLSEISKLFDPAGWLAPYIILSKILMRKIWECKTEWDDALPQDCLQDWNSFYKNYSDINLIKIPRWLFFTPDCEVEIHGFSDASEKAYAAALYVKVRSNNKISINLLAAKSKVAPVKCLSLPKLELCAAVLLSDMIESIIPSLNFQKYKIYKWSDSTIVLSWLRKPPCYWKTFVANRVSKILQSSGCDNWLHVSSESNPADLATRGMYPKDLAENSLWWHGPQWLKNSPKDWPKLENDNYTTAEEIKPINVNFIYFKNYEDILDRFSKFPKAIQTICYIFRFFYRTHPKYKASFTHSTLELTAAEISNVRNRLIQIAQQIAYPNEYKSLQNKENVKKSSTILNLNPFLDSVGHLRVNGRLVNSPSLSYDEKYPIILPYNCQFTRLLVNFSHLISLHGGNQQIVRLIRMQYWVPKLKNLVKTTIHNCKDCVVYKAKVRTQLMAALPPERTELQRPFFHTGLDFAGPFDIKNFTGRNSRITKGYVCVFVCFSTKAIHLEATSTLSTNEFMAAFQRFISRRGCPLHLYSDNGKTFVGASKRMARDFLNSSRSTVLSNFLHQNISWHFIPPGSPHMGGLWEAGVKSFKTRFRKIAGNFKFTFEEFSTLLARIESCLNSRPISTMSEDPMDLNALTPGHFLIGGPILAPPDPKIEDQPISIINRWQRLRSIQQHFCQRWKTEYLTELHKRNKWKQTEANINIGTIVVIKDENLPVNEWRLGRITRVYTGKDNLIRVADIYTKRGTITRPIVKLVVLPS